MFDALKEFQPVYCWLNFGFLGLISGLDVFNKLDVEPLILNEGKLFCVPSKLIEDALTVLCPTSSFAILVILEALICH